MTCDGVAPRHAMLCMLYCFQSHKTKALLSQPAEEMVSKTMQSEFESQEERKTPTDVYADFAALSWSGRGPVSAAAGSWVSPDPSPFEIRVGVGRLSRFAVTHAGVATPVQIRTVHEGSACMPSRPAGASLIRGHHASGRTTADGLITVRKGRSSMAER